MDEIVVHKFGGSCLRDGNDIDQIAEIIRSSEGRPIIVVSAPLRYNAIFMFDKDIGYLEQIDIESVEEISNS